MQFFIPMQPPTTTHNAKQLHAFMRGGKPCMKDCPAKADRKHCRKACDKQRPGKEKE